MPRPLVALRLVALVATLTCFAACSNEDAKREGQSPLAPLAIQPRAEQAYPESKLNPRPGKPAPAHTEQADATSNSTRLGSAAKQEVAQETVYITRTGKRYHRAGCRYLSKSMIPVERDKAIQSGYTPCHVCQP